MKSLLRITIFTLVLLFIENCTAQDLPAQQKYTAHNKGKLFISFGGNRGYFTESDIHFKGNNFDFTVSNAKAEDHPQGWHVDYINPVNMTIPQTNLRIGYFFNDHYSISIGVDHMKYIFIQNQTANVTGTINLPGSQPGSIYNGTYNNTPINFSDGTFLKFEHTNGLNYVTTEISRFDDISSIFNIFKSINPDKFQVNLTEGVGIGILYPKTDAVVLGKEEHDEFHIAGFGVSAKAGLNFTFYKHFFVQTELKTGYNNMPNIQITADKSEKASQQFGYFQTIISFGAIFKI
jgi:hypothetical protein